MKGPLKKSKQKIEQDYARNAIADYESGNKKAAKYEKKKELEVAAGEGPKMMGKSPMKQNADFKYMPLETDATGGRGGDMPAISKHMSKSPLGLYKSPAQMGNKSPLEANPNPSGKNKSRQTYSATLTTKPKPEVKAKKEKTNSGPTQQKQIMNSMRDAALSGLDKKAASGKTLDSSPKATRDKIRKMSKLQDIKAAAKKYGASSNVRDYIK